MQALQGKVAVITGGSSGIGLATANASLPKEHLFSLQDGDKRSWIKPRGKLARMLYP